MHQDSEPGNSEARALKGKSPVLYVSDIVGNKKAGDVPQRQTCVRQTAAWELSRGCTRPHTQTEPRQKQRKGISANATDKQGDTKHIPTTVPVEAVRPARIL